MWFFIIIGIVILGLLMLLKGNDLAESSDNSSTQNLTAADIRTYFPYMDNQTAIKYKDAILNGQYNFEVGKGLIEQWKKNRILKNSGPMRADSASMPTSEYTKVTWWQIQQYFPIMDSKISADYFADHLLDESKYNCTKRMGEEARRI